MSQYSDTSSYQRQANNITKNSISSSTQRERATVSKAQQKKKQRIHRIGAFALACMITGGIAADVVSNVAENIHNNAIINEVTFEFRKEVIVPNTHRTYTNQGYFYDYGDIAAVIKEEGKDFSAELYKTYASMGEYQTNCVLEYTNYDSVSEYVKKAGFEDIDAWKKSEREKIFLNAELNTMYSELNPKSESEKNVDSKYAGGK